MRWLLGADIEDVYLILRNGCNEANAIFLASLKSTCLGINLILVLGFKLITIQIHAFKRNNFP